VAGSAAAVVPGEFASYMKVNSPETAPRPIPLPSMPQLKFVNRYFAVILTDLMTIGSTGFSVAGSVSATPIVSTTSWPEVTFPSSA
jgi:hypothetical protein